ncbi:long-chain-acyl-CoA synthetase [Endozoicomonas arenosclerae]|uniref:long-chain-acyl-CoA synthetase n=1 Tax=Endozoicomonas arenosclerae TaxID=1633495 RepID=UPI0007867B00|nr:long-chain-acyl-CoA synthetase [Endozoicomonas arenosclerae]
MTVSREDTQARLDLQGAGATRHTPEQSYTVSDRFEELAEVYPNKTFLIYRDEKVTFSELNQKADQYSRLALSTGLNPGDTGAVMVENRPEFFYAWLGLAKAGITAALINTQARGAALSHALLETSSKCLFLGTECAELYTTVAESVTDIKVWALPDGENRIIPKGAEPITPALEKVSRNNLPEGLRKNIIGETPLFYVFTSGTTGLPKAAIISHMRWLGVGDGWSKLLGMTDEDVFYCILPLFHGAAGMSLVSNALSSNASIVLKRKFSASRFWDDVRQHNVTTTQYIGEICRYLVNQPEQPNDKEHTLKRMTGAGVSTEVWQRFIERFGEVEIYEGWGATEANCGIINVDCKPGSVGRIPFREKSNLRLVKYDLENDCHVKDENGFHIEAEAGEVGEALGMILNIPGLGAGRFEGYTDAEATEKKILRNVFTEGDAWFRSGDLLSRDEEDYYYFVDRIGDTFRWKSENVSTTEVSDALSSFEPAELINIYGVAVPDHEGRAGMAAIQLKNGEQFDGKAFYNEARGALPQYAMPLFVRIAEQSDLTATFKLRKVDLQKQGYCPDSFEDELYVQDAVEKTYVKYSTEALQKISIKPFEKKA